MGGDIHEDKREPSLYAGLRLYTEDGCFFAERAMGIVIVKDRFQRKAPTDRIVMLVAVERGILLCVYEISPSSG